MESLNAEIIRCLTLAPHSYIELLDSLPRRDPLQIKLLLRALIADRQVVNLEGRDDDGAPIYCLVGYLAPDSRRDHLDLVLGRDYRDSYTAPSWTADC